MPVFGCRLCVLSFLGQGRLILEPICVALISANYGTGRVRQKYGMRNAINAHSIRYPLLLVVGGIFLRPVHLHSHPLGHAFGFWKKIQRTWDVGLEGWFSGAFNGRVGAVGLEVVEVWVWGWRRV
jgi:hypothetical protein